MSCRHGVYFSVALSLLATTNTAYFALALDFIVNLIICIKIMWRTKKAEPPVPLEDDADLHALALNEKVVYIVPLTFIICAVVAYYGPNAWILGNVYNESWHFGRLEDFAQPVKIMAILFCIDIISIILWQIFLKIFSKISYYNGFMYIQRRFWFFMAIHEAFSLNEVNCKICFKSLFSILTILLYCSLSIFL